MNVAGAITISPGTFLAIVAASAVAGTLSATIRIGGLGAPAVVIELLLGVLAQRSSRVTLPLLERTLETSSQLAVRWIVVLVFALALALLAFRLGLDLLLGGFAAGMITRQLLKEHELPAFESKLSAVGFGVFVPFFFIVSGMKLDVTTLFATAGGFAKLVLFLALFLAIRGAPALLL